MVAMGLAHRKENKRRQTWGLLILGMLILFLSGCGRSPQEHAAFARAGQTYADAMDRLLEVSGDVSIDAHSARILQLRQLADLSDAQRRLKFRSNIQELTRTDRDRLETTRRLRSHARLLGAYFGKLNALATSSAPADAGTAVNNAFAALSKVGDQLRNPTLTGLAQGKDFSALTSFIVSSRIRGALNRELTARKDALNKEFKTQELLLDALSDDIKHNLELSANVQEDFLQQSLEVGVPEDRREAWMLKRRLTLKAPTTIGELSEASDSMGELRELFDGLLKSGKLDRTRFNQLLADFSSILNVIESLTKSTGGQS